MSDLYIHNQRVGTITLDEQRVRGEGGAHDPRIVLLFSVALSPQPSGAMLALTELRCSLHLTSPCFPNNQVGSSATISLLENMSCRSSTYQAAPGQIEVRLPLTEHLLASLEEHRHRHPEGNFEAYLSLHVNVSWIVGTGNASPAEAGLLQGHPLNTSLGPFSLLAPMWYPKIDDLRMQIPASVWVGQVLPPLGFSSLRLVEITLPTANGLLPDGLVASFDAAQSDYDLGNYRECIQKCRDVRNAIEHHLGATQRNPVADVIGDRLGLPTDAPQRPFLRNVWTGFADLTNASHHLSTVQGMLRADAHVCLLLTALLLEYTNQLR